MTVNWLRACLHKIVGPRRLRSQRAALDAVPKLNFNSSPLKAARNLALSDIFESKAIAADWTRTVKDLESLAIPDGTGGVNPGDRRAIYYLIRAMNPRSVLEIGTHIGASTVHLASAMLLDRAVGASHTLTSVDVAKVNDPVERRWEKFGARYSPAELIKQGGRSLLRRIHSWSIAGIPEEFQSQVRLYFPGWRSCRTDGLSRGFARAGAPEHGRSNSSA
jgi:hypothetical protein